MKKDIKNPASLKMPVFMIVLLVIGLGVGFLANNMLNDRPKTILVWAVDDTVKIPQGLKSYLEKDSFNDCHDYKGTNTTTGVALFAINRVVGEDFVKMNYGCSDNLNASIVAIKRDNQWSLIQPVEYNNGGDLPFCAALEKYNISKVAEPECTDAKRMIQVR